MRRFLANVFNTLNAEALVIPIVPLYGRDLPLAGRLAILVDDLGFDDVEDLFRVYITTCFALSPVGVDLECRFLKIRYGLDGWSIVSGIAPRIHNDHLVEHLIDVRRGLVNDDEDEFAFERQLFQKVDDVLGIS